MTDLNLSRTKKCWADVLWSAVADSCSAISAFGSLNFRSAMYSVYILTARTVCSQLTLSNFTICSYLANFHEILYRVYSMYNLKEEFPLSRDEVLSSLGLKLLEMWGLVMPPTKKPSMLTDKYAIYCYDLSSTLSSTCPCPKRLDVRILCTNKWLRPVYRS